MLADATYKLNNEGYPVLTCGTSDKEKVFHPFGLALTLNEKTEDFAFLFGSIKEAAKKAHNIDYTPNILIADSAPSITNGFKQVFNLTHRGTCWAHAVRGLDDILRKHPDIRQEIDLMQASPTQEIFEAALALFKRKYAKSEILKELESWWLRDEHNTWYEGFLVGLPSTSNNIESFHKNGLKVKSKLAKRQPTMQFLSDVVGVIRNHSLDRTPTITDFNGQLVANPNLQVFKAEPKITNEDYQEAHKWNTLAKEIRCYRGVYMIKAGKPETENDYKISRAECEQYYGRLRKPTDLNDYLENIHGIHLIRIQTDNWKLSCCSCSYWLKNYKCSHVIAIATRLHLTSFESIFIDLPMEKKRKPGARKKSKPALVRQSIDPIIVTPRGIEFDEESDEEVEAVVQPKKRGRKPKGSAAKKQRI